MWANTETSCSSARAGASTTMSIFELFLTRPNERLTVNPGRAQYLFFFVNLKFKTFKSLFLLINSG